MAITFSREMQFSRDELLREIPDAVGNRPHSVDGNQVTVDDGDKTIKIQLTDKGTNDLGSLHLPIEKVDFEFDGHSQQEVDQFMEHFDNATRKFGAV